MQPNSGSRIWAALDAATIALCALPMHAEHKQEAAAAVTAFLRAMPNDCVFLHDLATNLETVSNG